MTQRKAGRGEIAMPLSMTELIIGIVILIGVPAMTILLNKRRRGWGWLFLAGVVALFVIGNLIEWIAS